MRKKGKSYSLLRKQFSQKYKEQIVPTVMKYESNRKIRLVFACILSSIFFILGSFLLICAIYANDFSADSVKSIFFLYFLCWMSWDIIKKNFENSIKQKIMPCVCSCFENMKWRDIIYLGDENLFQQSGVVPKFNSKYYDDIFIGTHNDVKYEILEAEYDIGSGKYRRTVFKGVIVKIDMNKPFKSHTVIKPDTLMNISPLTNLHHTQLEDVQFNKKFDVYTDDEIGARVLITPIFMERLKNMKTAFSSNSVSCAFYQKYLIIALPSNKDLFSLCSLIKPVYDEKQYKIMYEEVLSIIKLIDYFKLDKN